LLQNSNNTQLFKIKFFINIRDKIGEKKMSLVTKIVNYGVRNAVVVNKEIFGMKNMPRNLRNGWQQGTRLSKIKHSGATNTMINKTIGVYRKGIYPHIPGLFAGIGTILPFPGTSIGGFCLGKILQKFIKTGISLKK
jgi:hypothetical protein